MINGYQRQRPIWVSISVIGAIVATAVFYFGAHAMAGETDSARTGKMQGMKGMTGMSSMGSMPTNLPVIPPVKAYAEGSLVYFIHTEASDKGVAKILTDMMGSPVLVLPALADVPENVLANVYAFKNGVQLGDGPFGYSPDVFDSPAGSEGYSPLRRVNLVFWQDGATPRVLKSAAEVLTAQRAGEIRIERTGIVVNMPMLTWPGGKR